MRKSNSKFSNDHYNYDNNGSIQKISRFNHLFKKNKRPLFLLSIE